MNKSSLPIEDSDCLDLARKVMEDMFILLFLDEGARQKIGFTHISRLFGEMPGWYLWTKDRKGVYLLELRKARPLATKMIKAYFLLRYYPSPEEPFFDDFAFIERQARLGPIFDQTGTPHFERGNEIHESLFAVGNLHLIFDHGSHLAKLKISSQDRWIEGFEDGLIMQTDTGEKFEAVPKGRIDRKVRGWELSWNFFDKSLLGFCYVHKSCPMGVRLTKSPGMIYHIDANSQVVEVPESTINGWVLEASLLLQSAKKSTLDKTTCPKTHWESILHSSKKGEILVECFANPPAEKHPWINANWWMAASWSFPPSKEFHHSCFMDH